MSRSNLYREVTVWFSFLACWGVALLTLTQ